MPLPPGTRPINQSGIPVEPGVTMILAPARCPASGACEPLPRPRAAQPSQKSLALAGLVRVEPGRQISCGGLDELRTPRMAVLRHGRPGVPGGRR